MFDKHPQLRSLYIRSTCTNLTRVTSSFRLCERVELVEGGPHAKKIRAKKAHFKKGAFCKIFHIILLLERRDIRVFLVTFPICTKKKRKKETAYWEITVM